MDTLPSSAGDLNDLERRLSEWRPSSTGLDTDRMLFAAGQDSVRGWGGIVWPVVSGCLALVASALGFGLAHERTARLELAAQVHKQEPADAPLPTDDLPRPEMRPSPEPPDANSYLVARRALAEGLDRWPTLARADLPVGPGSPSPRIWKAGQCDAVAADLQSADDRP
jgi:hypothetical protein